MNKNRERDLKIAKNEHKRKKRRSAQKNTIPMFFPLKEIEKMCKDLWFGSPKIASDAATKLHKLMKNGSINVSHKPLIFDAFFRKVNSQITNLQNCSNDRNNLIVDHDCNYTFFCNLIEMIENEDNGLNSINDNQKQMLFNFCQSYIEADIESQQALIKFGDFVRYNKMANSELKQSGIVEYCMSYFDKCVKNNQIFNSINKIHGVCYLLFNLIYCKVISQSEAESIVNFNLQILNLIDDLDVKCLVVNIIKYLIDADTSRDNNVITLIKKYRIDVDMIAFMKVVLNNLINDRNFTCNKKCVKVIQTILQIFEKIGAKTSTILIDDETDICSFLSRLIQGICNENLNDKKNINRYKTLELWTENGLFICSNLAAGSDDEQRYLLNHKPLIRNCINLLGNVTDKVEIEALWTLRNITEIASPDMMHFLMNENILQNTLECLNNCYNNPTVSIEKEMKCVEIIENTLSSFLGNKRCKRYAKILILQEDGLQVVRC